MCYYSVWVCVIVAAAVVDRIFRVCVCVGGGVVIFVANIVFFLQLQLLFWQKHLEVKIMGNDRKRSNTKEEVGGPVIRLTYLRIRERE